MCLRRARSVDVEQVGGQGAVGGLSGSCEDPEAGTSARGGGEHPAVYFPELCKAGDPPRRPEARVL